ncbi:MAG: alpha/beta fold hydrolase [Bacteroidales bacterium]
MELFYREYGSGQPLLLVHGLFGMSDNWVTMARKMAERFHVYLPDMRNHGLSPHSSHHSYPAMAEDIGEFIDKHKLEYPILMGHSMGGKAAMLFATENPSKVQRLIVVDISPKSYNIRDLHLNMLQVMMNADLTEMKSRKEVDDYITKTVDDPKIQQFILKNLYRPAPERFAWRVNLDSIYENLDLVAADLRFARQFDHPALFVRGVLSDYILDDDIPEIIKIFPQATFVDIPGAGHWIHADAPEALCKAVRDFTGKDCRYS